MPLWFWQWAHVKAEKLWHWIYYKKVLPRQEPYVSPTVIYSEHTFTLIPPGEVWHLSDKGLIKFDSVLREQEKQSDQSND